MITKASECSLKAFIAAMFDQDYTGLDGGGPEQFENIYMEFIDLSGIGETLEFDLMKAIHNIQVRQTYVKAMVGIHRKCFAEFSKPFPQAMDSLVKYGHRLKWDPAKPEDFLKQLDMVEIKEKRFVAELDKLNKELSDLKKEGAKVTDNARHDFLRTLLHISKHMGFKLDRETTNVEEFALMIKDRAEENNSVNQVKKQ